MKLLTRLGLIELAIELVLFLPITLYALWPRIRARLAARRAPSVAPQLTVLDGGGAATPTPTELPTPAPEVAPLAILSVAVVDERPPPANDNERDPPQLSSG